MSDVVAITQLCKVFVACCQAAGKSKTGLRAGSCLAVAPINKAVVCIMLIGSARLLVISSLPRCHT